MSLKAPCGSEFLHQHKVVTKWRKSEDKDGVEHTSCLSGFSVMSVPTEKIPGRRDYLEIYLYCEDCCKDHILSFTQHKGATLTEWTA
jgi:hypothetical protein